MFPLMWSHFPMMFLTGLHIFKLASFPVGMEATSLDIAKAYHNSPICPAHKKYLCIYWRDSVYIQHVAVKGLATAGGIQGNVADTTIALLKYHRVEPTIKWVNDFVFFHCPILSPTPSVGPSFSFDLSTIYNIMTPLGIPWHPLSKKGHDFQSSFSYVGFEWDISTRSVSHSCEKFLRLLAKVSNQISSPPPKVNKNLQLPSMALFNMSLSSTHKGSPTWIP